jgi:hypothetical protein
MAAPTQVKTIGFPGQVTVPADGGPSATAPGGAEFNITLLDPVVMTFSLPAESNVSFGNGGKVLVFPPETFSSVVGKKQITRPFSLSVPTGQTPDSPVAIRVSLNYANDPQTVSASAALLVRRASLAGVAAIAAGAAAVTAAAVALGRRRGAAGAKKKSPARPAAKRSAAKRASSKKVAAKKPAAKKSAAKKSAAKKSAAKKSTSKQSTSRKPASKKSTKKSPSRRGRK